MRRRFPIVLIALLGMGQSLLSGGEPRQLQLKWSELGPRVEDRKVALVVTGGAYIEGKVQRVVPDGMWLRVSKTSDHKAQPKGSHLIPRPSVSMLQVTEYGKLGRLLVTAGAVAAVAGFVAAANPDVSEGPGIVAVPAISAAGIIGAAVGGYHAGKKLDKRVVEIHIVVEDAEVIHPTCGAASGTGGSTAVDRRRYRGAVRADSTARSYMARAAAASPSPSIACPQ